MRCSKIFNRHILENLINTNGICYSKTCKKKSLEVFTYILHINFIMKSIIIDFYMYYVCVYIQFFFLRMVSKCLLSAYLLNVIGWIPGAV